MFEKRWAAVPPQVFISDGSAQGAITVIDSSVFKVKQAVDISSSTLPNLNLEIKSIIDDVTIWVGPIGAKLFTYTDVSAYLVADGAAVSANEQKRSSVPVEEINRAVYEEEPVVAERVILVDKHGRKYTGNNRLPVEATVNLTASKAGVPTIFNKLVVTPNTETSVILPDKTEMLTITTRSNKAIKLKYSFVPGESGTKYITVRPGNKEKIFGIGLTGVKPIYFQLSSVDPGGTIVEIETWNS